MPLTPARCLDLRAVFADEPRIKLRCTATVGLGIVCHFPDCERIKLRLLMPVRESCGHLYKPESAR